MSGSWKEVFSSLHILIPGTIKNKKTVTHDQLRQWLLCVLYLKVCILLLSLSVVSLENQCWLCYGYYESKKNISLLLAHWS